MASWSTRQTLIQKVKDKNDQQAWNDFFNYYRGYILVVLHKMNIHESNQDDILQEVLLALTNYLQDFEYDPERSQFRRWLSVVIRNKALNFIRTMSRYKNRNEKVTQEVDEDDFISKPELDELIQKEWEVYIAKTALKNIESTFYGKALEAFDLYISGEKTADIARRLDIRQNSVLTLVNRVKVRLADEVMTLKENLEF